MTRPSTDVVITAAMMIRLNHVWVVLRPDSTMDSAHTSKLAAKEQAARAWLYAIGEEGRAASRHITWLQIIDAQVAGWRIVECELTPVDV